MRDRKKSAMEIGNEHYYPKLKCLKGLKTCRCIARVMYAEKKFQCAGIVKNPKPRVDVIRLCDNTRKIFEATPDEALADANILASAVKEWLISHREYWVWRRKV